MNFDKKCSILDNRIRRIKEKNNLCFVLCDKFGRALRNSISFIPSIDPDLIIAERGSVGKPGFISENELGIIGDSHYLANKDRVAIRLRQNIGSREARFLSWTPKRELVGLGEFLCSSDEVRGHIEDKTNLQTILHQSGIDTGLFTLKQDIFVSKEDIPNFSVLAQKYGLPFVLQGWSKGGDGTIIVKTIEDFERKMELHGAVRVSEFSNKQYGSIYACVVPNKQTGNGTVIMDRPAFKVVGIPQHGIPDVLGGGCNWGQVPDIDLEETRKNVEKIGLYLLQRFGYTGSLVLEGFFIEGKFVFNELNARLGGGNEISGFNQIMHGELPMQAIHYALKLGIPCDDLINESEFHEKHMDTRADGCFYFKLIGRNNGDFRVGKLTDGSYRFYENNLALSKTTDSPYDRTLRDHEILLSNLAHPLSLCKGDAHICMIEGKSCPQDQLITGPKSVSGLVLQISDLVYNSLVYG